MASQQPAVALAESWQAARQAAIGFALGLREQPGWAFRVSKTCPTPTAVASATACLLVGFLDGLEQISPQQRAAWCGYLQSVQRPDGLLADDEDIRQPVQKQPQWALLAHRTRHIGWAIETLGGRLPRPVAFVEPLLKPGAAAAWLDDLWRQPWPGGFWGVGNWVMDLGVLLDFQHRHFGDPAARASLEELLDALTHRQDPRTGFWCGPNSDIRNCMAGAMHLYPMYWAYGRPVPHLAEAAAATLELQQSDGLFGYDSGHGGSQCLDYDAVLILANAHAAGEGPAERISQALRRVLEAIGVNRNPDGSWADCQSDREACWATRATTYIQRQGSLWDTYARLMTVAMCLDVLGRRPDGLSDERHWFEIFHAGAGWRGGRSPARLT